MDKKDTVAIVKKSAHVESNMLKVVGHVIDPLWYPRNVRNKFMSRNVLFSDEATFSSNEIISTQNYRWWSDRNFTIKTRDQYAFKMDVWRVIYSN